MTRLLTITTSGHFSPRRWWIVRIHPNLPALRRAAAAYDSRADFSDAYGVCHPAGNRFRRRGYAGIIRYCQTHMTGELVTHELMHAALAVYRTTVTADVRLGRGCGQREEQLAYIYGELYASLERHFQHSLKGSP